jgi:ABC-type Na+ efflux pump permease subunit
MDKNKMIILALIVVIAALLVGMAAMMMPNMGKQDTKLKFKSNSTLTEGDSLKVKLTDANGTAMANQTVNIIITNKNKSTDHSVVTNEKGVGTLKMDKNAGKYNVTVSYGGNDKYNGCNVTKKITIEEKVAEATVSETSAQSSQSGGSSTHTIIGEDGYYYTVDDNGNFLENLGSSKQYRPNEPNSVYYPDAEPANRYVDKSK